MAVRTLFEGESIAAPDLTTELNLELAEDAARLLGYAKLKEAVAAKKGVSELSRVLQELDIQPFCETSVERYKAGKPDAAEIGVPEFFKRHRKVARMLLWFVPVWVIVSALGVAGGWFISWKLGLASLVVMFVILMKGCEFDDRLAALFPRWERVSLAGYEEEVPLYVLRKAVDIKKRLPGAEFYIEQQAKDPFLIVKCGAEEYYIEVWREPRFEASVANPMPCEGGRV
jgi:hypothetical protein